MTVVVRSQIGGDFDGDVTLTHVTGNLQGAFARVRTFMLLLVAQVRVRFDDVRILRGVGGFVIP